ncbi:unnamed protein product, partial [Owenia fusiformis]
MFSHAFSHHHLGKKTQLRTYSVPCLAKKDLEGLLSQDVSNSLETLSCSPTREISHGKSLAHQDTISGHLRPTGERNRDVPSPAKIRWIDAFNKVCMQLSE